ncbi:MAG TPA: hypothetical protein VNO70_22605 [Blastocatellia bacterium]|nr:hypothetical protein [Blastocatellia bacterium]
MKDRVKLILVGLGFTFGLQVLISLIFTGLAFAAARSEAGGMDATVSIMVLGLTLGAFLIGGFVIGWMSEELRIAEAVGAAVLTLIISAGLYLAIPEGSNMRDQFVTGLLLSNVSLTGRSVLFAVLAIIAAAAGAYIGWHVKVPQEGALDRVALLLGLLGAVIGPFVLLAVGGRDPANPNQPNLPWYVLAIVLLVLLALIGVGFVMFTREHHEGEEISISPERRDI